MNKTDLPILLDIDKIRWVYMYYEGKKYIFGHPEERNALRITITPDKNKEGQCDIEMVWSPYPIDDFYKHYKRFHSKNVPLYKYAVKDVIDTMYSKMLKHVNKTYSAPKKKTRDKNMDTLATMLNVWGYKNET